MSRLYRPVEVDLKATPELDLAVAGRPARAADRPDAQREDTALTIYVGFPWDPDRASLTERLKRPLVEALAGEDAPGRVLAYVFGGQQRRRGGGEPAPGFAGFMRVLQPANSPVGQWFEELADLAKDYWQAFGENAPDPVQPTSRPTPTTPARAAAASSKGSRSLGGAMAPPPTH